MRALWLLFPSSCYRHDPPPLGSRRRARRGAMVLRMVEAATLYLVHLDVDVATHPDPSPDLFELAPGLYLTESTRSRSQVYHAIKWRLQPARLLVAPLAGDPKFKGMRPGALSWLRARRRERHDAALPDDHA